MSPIIDLQRRMLEAGRIRAGDFGDGHPRKLTKWRLTSKDRERLELAAQMWGGEVKPWKGREGEFELYTDTDTLPIMLMPGHEPTTWYELWSKGGCQRRCDGQHELISDSACLCGEEKECKPTTRLSVLLPDLPGLGSWMLSSTGWNAAAELAGAADLLQRASAQGVLLPAKLRLEQRTSVRAGQTLRFAVPVIDIGVSFRELMGTEGALVSPHQEQRALPAGYTPIASTNGGGTSLEAGLAVAETQELTRKPRVPLPEDDDILDDEAAATGNTVATSTRDKPLTQAQAKKLNVLVGQLRDAGKIETQHLWAALAKDRNIEVELLIAALGGEDATGLHWSPLRDSLTRSEANALIDRLEKVGA